MKKTKKKRLLAIALSLLLVGCLITAGTKYKARREEEKRQDSLAVQKQFVPVLKSTFTDIAEVKFNKAATDGKTGSYSVVVTMTNTAGESVDFTYTFWKRRNENKIDGYTIHDENVQKKGITKHKIKVIYSNGEVE